MALAGGIFAIALAVVLSALLWLISVRYAPRFEGQERVVMNWSITGEPNAYATPRMALSVTPAVGTGTLLVVGCLVAFATPARERMLALPMIVVTGLVLAAIHAAHMHFAARAAER